MFKRFIDVVAPPPQPTLPVYSLSSSPGTLREIRIDENKKKNGRCPV